MENFLLSWLKQFEGWAPNPYICPGGYKTVGYGHVMEENFPYSLPLSLDDAEGLLRRDIDVASKALDKLAPVSLTLPQKAALISLIFNIGSLAFQRSSLRQKLLRLDHRGVVAEFGRWIWAGGIKSRGLIRRRAAEVHLYQSPALEGI